MHFAHVKTQVTYQLLLCCFRIINIIINIFPKEHQFINFIYYSDISISLKVAAI